MALKASTGLRNGLLTTGSLASLLNGGLIRIYTGAVPATADAAVSDADLLCTISLDGAGGGISLAGTASAGIIAKSTAESWSGTNAATGTATFFRHVAAGDTGDESITAPRLQGQVATAGAELNLSSTNLISGAVQTIDYYSIALPTL